MRKYILFVCSILILWNCLAQNNIVIPNDQITIDGDLLNVNPGDTIFLAAGIRPELEFKNIRGSESQAIVIMPEGEKVTVDTDAHTGIVFRESSFVHLTGKLPNNRYGIEVSRAGTMGLYVLDYSSELEADHLEIHGVGFAGIMAKTDPVCSNPDVSDFVMRNVSFHDNYIHDTGGEGFYVGYTWYPTREVDCNGQNTILKSHVINGLKIYNNIIRDTGWDGLQIGASINAEIYGNDIRRYGLEEVTYQTGGVQIGGSSSVLMYNNFVSDGVGGGLSLFGRGNISIYNNVFANVGEFAIYHNDRDALVGRYYRIYNNTIVNPEQGAISLNTVHTEGNLVANNLVVLEGAYDGISGVNSRWTSETNIEYENTSQAGFVFSDTLNFRLTEASPLIDAGSSIGFLKYDFNMDARPAGSSYDVGAFEFGSVPYVAPVLVANNQPRMLIFPNPSRPGGSLSVELPKLRGVDSLIMTDLSGHKVLEYKFPRKTKASVQLNLPDELAAGVYLLSIIDDSSVVFEERLVID